MSNPLERRVFRVVIEEVPMSCLGGQFAGKNRRNCARTKSQHCPKWHAVRQEIFQELSSFKILPAESVDQHEDREASGCFLRESAQVLRIRQHSADSTGVRGATRSSEKWSREIHS